MSCAASPGNPCKDLPLFNLAFWSLYTNSICNRHFQKAGYSDQLLVIAGQSGGLFGTCLCLSYRTYRSFAQSTAEYISTDSLELRRRTILSQSCSPKAPSGGVMKARRTEQEKGTRGGGGASPQSLLSCPVCPPPASSSIARITPQK